MVAIPTVLLYDIVLTFTDSPVKYANELSVAVNPTPADAVVTPASADADSIVNLVAEPTPTLVILPNVL